VDGDVKDGTAVSPSDILKTVDFNEGLKIIKEFLYGT
jgi:hypothetical protein